MLFVMFLCSLSGILPKLFPTVARNKNVISFMNCFSAGIFLGMALIHVIPEGVEMYAHWSKTKKIEKPFPLDYVLIFVGYLIVLGFDRVMKIWLLRLHDHHDHHDHNHWEHHDINDDHHEHEEHDHKEEKSEPGTKNKVIPNKSEDSSKLDHGHAHDQKKKSGELQIHVEANPDVLIDFDED